MLNATINKGDYAARMDPTPYMLKDIIIMDEGSVEGLIRGVKALSCRCAMDGLLNMTGL